MREIKFRAWDKKRKELLRITMMDFAEWWVSCRPPGTQADPLEYGERNSFKNEETDRHILMQYTGLKDKNGVEIYEGDLMTFPPTYHEYEGIFIIRWNPKEVWFSPINAKDKGYDESNNIYVSPDPREWKEGKIIGNIYENPELVEIEKSKPNKKIN